MKKPARLALVLALTAALASSWHCGIEGKGAAPGPASTRTPTPEQLTAAGMSRVMTQWAHLRPAAGLPPTDYEGFGVAGDDPALVRADGTFLTDLYDVRPGTVFATPRDGSTTLAWAALETGIYMSPYAGNGVRMTLASDATGRTAYAASNVGYVVLDATTTVVTAILSHPAMDTLESGVRTRQLGWVCATLAGGWPAVATAAAAYDAALAGRRDPVLDPTFDAALGQAVRDTLNTMPDFSASAPGAAAVTTEPFGPRVLRPVLPATQRAGIGTSLLLWGFGGAKPDEKVTMTVASAGKYATYVDLEPMDATKGAITAKTSAGTAVDYYFTARLVDRSRLPPDSTAHLHPQILDRLPVVEGVVASGILPAKSIWSYLDVVGNAADWVSQTVGERAGALSVQGRFEVAAGDLVEVRFFSGGKRFGNDPLVFQHVERNYAPEAHKAFAHNVAMLTTESILLIPGADVVLGEDMIGRVMTAAVTKALMDLQGNVAAQSEDAFASQLLSVCSNAAKVAVDTAIKETVSAKRLQRRGWRKVLSFFTKGGRRLLTSAGKHLTGGSLAKGGSIANRALRMGRPPSIMEYHVVDVGGGACRELMKKAAASPNHGLRSIELCASCLAGACEPQCVAMLKLESQADGATGDTAKQACSAACNAAVQPCKAELQHAATACNQACGDSGRRECMALRGNAMNACLSQLPGDCMRKCKVTDAMTGKPCLDALTACQNRCFGGPGATDDPMEDFYECTQARCKSQCRTVRDG